MSGRCPELYPSRITSNESMPARIIHKIEKIATHPLKRRIALGAMLLFMIFVDPTVDKFLQPDLPIVDLEHLIVGSVTASIGFFFMWLTAYFVRRLTKTEVEKQALFTHFDYLSKYANDIVVLVDEDRKIVEVNDRALSTYGYTREEMSALDPTTLRVSEERQKLSEQIHQVSVENGSIFETLHQRKDGTTFPVEVSARIFSRGGKKYLQSIIRDVTDRKRDEEAIQMQRDRLRNLATRAEHIREDERKNLAREIHDQLGQELTAIKMNIAVLEARSKTDEVLVAKVQYIRQLVDNAIRTTRKISTSLRPGVLDQLGLDAAIEWQVREFEKHYAISCTYKIEREPMKVKEGIDIALLRILQESLTNVAKHSGATQVMVKLEVSGKDLHLTVFDNGRGIRKDYEEKLDSFGILGMKERAFEFGGTVTIDPLTTKGTRIAAHIPEALL
jgi:PAS domain S-box-containing protein